MRKERKFVVTLVALLVSLLTLSFLWHATKGPELATYSSRRVFIDKPLIPSHNNIVLVYCNWASNFVFQSYIWDSVRQSRLLNPDIRIVILTSKEAIASLDAGMNDTIQNLNVDLIDFSDAFDKSEAIKEFNKVFFISGNMVPIDGNDKFNYGTSIRLYIVHQWMLNEKATNVFHLENDNVLYRDLTAMTRTFHESCGRNVAFTVPKLETKFAVVSFAYFADFLASEKLVNFIIAKFAMGQEKLVAELGDQWVNDMTIVAKYVPDSGVKDGVTALPSYYPQKEDANCIWNSEKVIYDAAIMGQYFGGTHANPGINWFEPQRNFPEIKDKRLEWKQCTSNRNLTCPYLMGFPVGNLHIHSKQLQLFMSRPANKTQ